MQGNDLLLTYLNDIDQTVPTADCEWGVSSVNRGKALNWTSFVTLWFLLRQPSEANLGHPIREPTFMKDFHTSTTEIRSPVTLDHISLTTDNHIRAQTIFIHTCMGVDRRASTHTCISKLWEPCKFHVLSFLLQLNITLPIICHWRVCRRLFSRFS